jgi:thioredoxin 1
MQKPFNRRDYQGMFDAAADKTVVVKFGADWCKVCKDMAPEIEELRAEYPDVVFIDYDLDAVEHDHDANVKAPPAFKVFTKGELVGEFAGRNMEKLRELL